MLLIRKVIYKTLAPLIDTLFPEKCSYCHKENLTLGNALCGSCLSSITTIQEHSESRCSRCGAIQKDSECECEGRIFFFSKSVFIWSYQKAARALLKQAKFQERKNALFYIKENIPDEIWEMLENSKDAAILLMSSSKSFVKKASKYLAVESNLPFYSIFAKKKKKLQNKLLHRSDRYMQIEENLILKRPSQIQELSEKFSRFYIVDDVWTSGASMNFAAKLLHDMGIPKERIIAMALFRRDRAQRQD